MYGIPALNSETALKAPDNPDILEMFVRGCIEDFRDNIDTFTQLDERCPVLAEWLRYSHANTEDNWRIALE